jgi:hypothetical protein
MDTQAKLIAVAQAEDTANLLDHIAWTDVILPKLNKLKENYAKILVAHLLGTPLPEGKTKEQYAGLIYGIDAVTNLLSNILRNGKSAFEDLNSQGIHLS